MAVPMRFMGCQPLSNNARLLAHAIHPRLIERPAGVAQVVHTTHEMLEAALGAGSEGVPSLGIGGETFEDGR